MTLEELLNKLIERWWRPNWEYNWPHKPFIRLYEDRAHWKQFFYNEWWDWDYSLQKVFSLRDIVSKESGLRQFCVENGMVKMAEWFYWQNIFPLDSIEYEYVDYQYWIIESALCDEDKLEEFLLENIKVE